MPTIAPESAPRPVLAFETTRQPGERLDRYIILGTLGEGGMGVVYAAYDPKLDRKIALKVLSDGLIGSARTEARERMVAEARAIARVNHANVVAVHDVGVVDDEVFVGMEFVDGQTLASWREQSPHTWQEVVDVFVEVAKGLAAVHAAGLVHRDVKPGNILIDTDGRVRVTDFGLARPTTDAPTVLDAPERAVVHHSLARPRMDLTMTGAYLGTPAYMSPEQFLGADVTALSDQFGFAASLWEALYGVHAFSGKTFTALQTSVLSGTAPTPPANANIPRWLYKQVIRGLAREPTNRWPSMHAWIDALVAGDPKKRVRRLWALGLGLTACVGAAAGTLVVENIERQEHLKRCEAKGQSLTWSPEHAKVITQQFALTSATNAKAIANSVTSDLSVYAEKWRTSRQQACLGSEQFSDWNEEQQRRAGECLDEQKAQFEATVAELKRADKLLVARAKRTVQGLPDIDHCTDKRRLQQLPPRPQDPRVRKQVHQLATLLSRTFAEEHSGRYQEGLKTSQEILTQAKELGYAPLIARAQFRVAAFQEKLGKYEDAVNNFLSAYRESAIAGDEEAAGDAARILAFTEGY